METEHGNDDKRKRDRVHFSHEVTLSLPGEKHVYNETYDISMEGVFIATKHPLPPGTEGEMELRLTMGDRSGPAIKSWFKVVNLQGTHASGKGGMGLHFLRMDSDSSMELYRLISYNQPI